jgi:hypothetical protein
MPAPEISTDFRFMNDGVLTGTFDVVLCQGAFQSTGRFFSNFTMTTKKER